jgi:hypothetical protein
MTLDLPHVEALAKKNPAALASLIEKMPLDRNTRKQVYQVVQKQIRITLETTSKLDAINHMYLYTLYKLAGMLKDAELIKTYQLPAVFTPELEVMDRMLRPKVLDAIKTLLADGIDRIVDGKKEV